jgi:hypothetical protein
MAVTAVAKRGVGIALACRAFGVSESHYCYSPKLDGENEEIVDLPIGLTNVRETWADECPGNLGVQPVLFVSARRLGAYLESQKGVSHLPRARTEPEDRTSQKVEARQA